LPLLLTLALIVVMYLSPVELFPSLAPYRPVLVLSAIGLPAALMAGVLHRFSFRAPQIYLLLAFAGALAFSRVYQGWLGGALRAWEDFGPTIASFLMTAIVASAIRRQKALALTFVAIALYLVMQGALAYHFGYREEQFIRLDWQMVGEGEREKTLKRICGPGFLNDPNDLAQNLLIALPLLGAFWKKRRWLRNALLVLAPAVWILYGLLLTRSRGAAVGLAVMAGLAVRDRLGKMGTWVLSGLLAGGLLGANFWGARVVSLREGSISGRVDAWGAGLQMLKESPLFGIGFRDFTDRHELTAHNSFVLCFAETGLVGYFFWMGLLVATARDLELLARLPATDTAQEQVRRWARTVRLAFYTFLATAWFLSRTYIPTLYLLIAMGVGLREIAHQNGWIKLPGLDRKWLVSTVALQLVSIALVYLTVRLRWMQ
jgi:hypothetical protein